MRQILLLLFCLLALPDVAQAEDARVFCAEALWCDLATGLGGKAVETTSILTSPRIDPHDFQVTPDMARSLANANIVVLTGGHYDDWVAPLLAAQPQASRRVISAVDLVRLAPDGNPHLFDDPVAIGLVVDALAANLAESLPGKVAEIAASQARYHQMLEAFSNRLKELRPHTQGMKIAVTEPVGGPLFAALGLEIIDPDFALACMNHVDPAPQDVATLEEALQRRTVRVLVVNPAVTGAALARLIDLARQSGIAIVEFDEFPTPPLLWQDWMSARLDRLVAALGVHD